MAKRLEIIVLKDYNVLDGFVITLLVMPDTGDEQRCAETKAGYQIRRHQAETTSNESKAKPAKMA